MSIQNKVIIVPSSIAYYCFLFDFPNGLKDTFELRETSFERRKKKHNFFMLITVKYVIHFCQYPRDTATQINTSAYMH